MERPTILLKEERRLEVRNGKDRRWLRVFVTDTGTFTMEDLAVVFDCGISKIRRDYNKHGFCPERWAKKERRGRRVDDPDWYAEFEGLSDESRSERVAAIQLGRWEQEQIQRQRGEQPCQRPTLRR